MVLYDICAVVGLLAIASIGYKLFGILQFFFHSSMLYRYAHNPNPSLKLDRQLSKPWALITGASDGVGKGLAEEFCSRGFHVVIHGRPGAKLEKVKSDLEKEFNADVRLLALDVSAKSTWTKFDQTIQSALDGINLTVLVNNLGGPGGVTPEWASITDRTLQDDEIMIDVNLRFMTHLTRVVLPILVKNSPGLIMNVSSAGEFMPMPWTCVYAGGKGYVKQYSHSLRVELKAEGKDVECVSLTTGKVVTGGSGRTAADVAFDTPSARGYAKAILDKVGYESPAYVPYYGHYLGLGVIRLLPSSWVDTMMTQMMEQEKIKKEDSKKAK